MSVEFHGEDDLLMQIEYHYDEEIGFMEIDEIIELE